MELAHVDPPNFFEVFIRDADLDFSLNLSCKSRKQTIWNHEIRAGQKRSIGLVTINVKYSLMPGFLRRVACCTTDNSLLKGIFLYIHGKHC